ncbi:DNA-binding winged helix-turn-helix (wHTH) domain-containing protein [Sphingomonas guangdongensis]|uniref:DNA-binding winged helix-turn-helix (WHTH) domain-containing protein n=1 Tax=Sphingomonas guangdongensis TaxID=1141890 RepID=A0A285R3E9_9SPHN|nr:transcriptional regulator [Sphingomonas guangdongensis]SOB88288.1 DNA-binding winged helix-turn-helix (wHTH) domain-containing protein [Sphingomonas guangdongensis]
MHERYRFGPFTLDMAERSLRESGRVVEVSGRYLDALALLVREGGALVTKDRFMAEVWRGVPVTDEALTQAIRSLRRALGDDVAAPRFIATVPKHGYRFVAAVDAPDREPSAGTAHGRWRRTLLLGGAGTIGAGMAGLIGGLIYGIAATAQPLAPGLGAASVLLVLVCLTELVALVGGAGVALGIAVARRASAPSWRWAPLGGAAGGLIVGGLTKLLGLDAFNLILGRSPGDMTGAGEGLLLGAAVGTGGWLASRASSNLRVRVAVAALVGSAAGAIIPQFGGRLMAGSLDLLAQSFPSRLLVDHWGALVGERGFGPLTASLTGALEGGLFAGCLIGGMLLAERQLVSDEPSAVHQSA